MIQRPHACWVAQFFAHRGINLMINLIAIIGCFVMRRIVGVMFAGFNSKLSGPISAGKIFPNLMVSLLYKIF